MPRAFEVLEHPADIGFRSFGTDLPELFVSAAMAVQALAFDVEAVRPAERFDITVAGDDIESLLVNWVNEVIYYNDGRHIALSRVEIISFGDDAITAAAFGEARDPSRHAPRLVIKAATFHQLRVAQEDRGWMCEVYLDV